MASLNCHDTFLHFLDLTLQIVWKVECYWKHSYMYILTISFQLEIYDDPVEASQYKPGEEEITVLEEKVSVVRRSVWGWSSRVKVRRIGE